MDKVEQVARAIHDGIWPGKKWTDCYSQKEMRDAARTAIKAMREPTVDMCMVHDSKSWDDWTAFDLWQAMIDAALDESDV